MNNELKKLQIMNRIAKLEERGDNAPIISKLRRKLRKIGA